MSTAAPIKLATPTEPVRGRAERAIDYTRRHAWLIGVAGLALWAASAIVLSLHAHGLGFPDPTRFSMTTCWLIGAGCMGNPNIAMRALGRRLTPTACLTVAACCACCALLLTALFWTGAMHPLPLIATFSLILPEAGAIQAYNTAEGEIHARRREEAAYQRGRTDEAAEQLEARYRAIANLDRLDSMGVGELGMLIEVASGLRNAKLCEHAPLRLVPAPLAANGHRRTGMSADPA